MAFLVKNSNKQRTAGPAGNGQAVLEQWIHIVRPALTIPQSTNEQLFRIYGGKILVHLLLGTVTTLMGATNGQLTIDGYQLSDAAAVVGSVKAIAATADTADDEVGGMYVVEGDGSAFVLSTAGAAYIGSQNGKWIMPQGEIVLVAAASSVTGAAKWDLFYQPLDEGAYAVAVPTATVKI